MSSSPSVVTAKRDIHEGIWELLYIELIEQFSNSSLIDEDGNNNVQKDQLIQVKLEKLGFQVGQRLIERFYKYSTIFTTKQIYERETKISRHIRNH
jgi:hypothetical protein